MGFESLDLIASNSTYPLRLPSASCRWPMSPWIRLPVIARIHSACHRLLAGGRLFHIFTPLAIGFLHVGSESLDLVIDPAIRCYGSSLASHFLFKSMSPRGVACSIGLAWDVRLILLRFLSIFPRPVHARLTTHDDDHDGRCGLGGQGETAYSKFSALFHRLRKGLGSAALQGVCLALLRFLSTLPSCPRETQNT